MEGASGKNIKSGKRLVVLLSIMILLAFLWFLDLRRGSAPNAAKDARMKAHIDQIKLLAENYYDFHGSYIGLSEDFDYKKICEDINSDNKIGCLSQINEKSYCVKTKLIFSSDGKSYWCSDANYDGRAGDDYCTPEKPYCTDPASSS